MEIRRVELADADAVVELWQICGLVRPWNDPRADIERKLMVGQDLFLVGEVDVRIVATAMGGYEGHRGWINYLAVHPDQQRQGLGREMVAAVEAALVEAGCPKVNLQIREDNLEALLFYEAIGYVPDQVVSLGKRLVRDE